MLTPQDTEILQQARLARFRTFFPLDIATEASCLKIKTNNPGGVIVQVNILLCHAAIILGTNELQILDTNNNLIFTAELKSEQCTQEDCYMTAATAHKAVEFEASSSAATPDVVTWSRITAIMGEKEEQLRSRLKDTGIPFYWADDTWAVSREVASQLIISFRTEQGQQEAAMLLGGSQPFLDQVPTEGRRKPKAEKAEKAEFQPLKRGVTATLEKYLKFAAPDNEYRQAEILSDIAEEGAKGKRHVTKILNSYPSDIAKPKASEFYFAASRLMAKRQEQTGQEAETNSEQVEETSDE